VQNTSNTNAAPSSFQLSSTYNDLEAQGNVTDLVIYMTADDIAQLLLTPPVGRSLSTTYLVLLRDTVFSPFGHSNVEVSRRHAMVPTKLTVDKFPPYVTSFSLFMNTGVMWLEFTEPIDPATFTLDGLVLQSRAYIGDGTNDPVVESQTVDLMETGSSLVSLTNLQRTLYYQLGTVNMNRIKARIGLAVTRETSYIAAWKPFVNDTTGNSSSSNGFVCQCAVKRPFYTLRICVV
jgi:hypothetical protein